MPSPQTPSTTPAVPSGNAGSGSVTASSLFGQVWRRRYWIGVPVAVVGALTVAWLATTTPLYRSTAKLLIETQESAFTQPTLSTSLRERLDAEAVSSQVQLIQSLDLSRQVVDELDLADHPEFAPSGGGSLLSGMMSLVGITRDPSLRSDEQKVLDTYYERLSVYQIEGSRVIAIDFSSEDSELAARAANAIASGYVDMQRAAKRETTLEASNWLGSQIEDLRAQVADAEQSVEDFRRENGLFSNLSTGPGGQSLADQQLAELTSQLAAVRTQKSDAQAKARMIADLMESGAPLEASEVLSSPIIQALSEQQAQTRNSLAELSSTLGPRHPRIQELEAELAASRRQIREEAESIVRALENDARVATEREMALLDNIDSLKGGAADANMQEVQLRALQREADSRRSLLESMLARYTEANAREAFAALPADARLISRAIAASEPYFPKTLPTLLAVILATTVLAAGIVVTLELMKAASAATPPGNVPESVAGRRRDLTAHLDVPATVGLFPKPVPRPRQAGLSAIGDAIVDSISADRARIILLTSVRSSERLPDIAQRLSRLISSPGHRIVVVDTAFGENLTAEFGDADKGLGDLLMGKAAFESVLHRDAGSRVHFIPAGSLPADPLMLIASDRMEAVLDALGQTYDAILLLAPGINRRADARLLARRSDFAILLARGDGGDAVSLRARERLHDAGVGEIALVTMDDEEVVHHVAPSATELHPVSAASEEATAPRASA